MKVDLKLLSLLKLLILIAKWIEDIHCHFILIIYLFYYPFLIQCLIVWLTVTNNKGNTNNKHTINNIYDEKFAEKSDLKGWAAENVSGQNSGRP